MEPSVTSSNDNNADVARVIDPDTRLAIERLFPDEPRIIKALNTIDNFNLNVAEKPKDPTSYDAEDIRQNLIKPLVTIYNTMSGTIAANERVRMTSTKEEQSIRQQSNQDMTVAYKDLRGEAMKIMNNLGYSATNFDRYVPASFSVHLGYNIRP